MTKQVSGHCGVGKMMKRWKFWDNSKCHSCDEPNEDTCHILYCLHEDCRRAWDEAVVGLDEWMTSVDTDPLIQYCIVSALRARDPNTIFHAYTNSPRTYAVAAEQDHIGWLHFIKGRVSRHWQLLQDEYYWSIASKCTSRSWTEGLVSDILSLVHKQWIACNAIVHARNERGLKVREGQELALAIKTQFRLDVEGLLPQDCHLITHGKESVEQMTATGQKTWLQSIQIACEVYESEIELETMQLQNLMYSWMNGA
jgi:hypothetical protein